MTTYSTSFDSYTADVQPSDWTARWVTTTSTWLTRAKAGMSGAKSLEHTGTGGARHLLTWDALDADANRANTEILARVRTSGNTAEQFRLTARASGAAAAETGYSLVFNNVSDTLQLQKIVAGTVTLMGNTVPSHRTINVWYYVRFRVNGTTLQGKFWADGEKEPTAWQVTTTDSSISAAGWVGIGNQEPTGTRDIDWFSVGTNGDTAPLITDSATVVRTSQAVMEAALATVASARASQVVVEAALKTVAPARISQMVTEVAISAPIPGQISQVVVEVAFSNAVAVTQQPRMIVLM